MSPKAPAFIELELDLWPAGTTGWHVCSAAVHELVGGQLLAISQVPDPQLASHVEAYEQLYDIRRIDLARPEDGPRLYHYPELLAIVRRINGRPTDYLPR